jgi:CRP-like cAMP-binding protein
MSAEQSGQQSAGTTVKAKAGEALFRQGESQNCCFIIKSGQVELVRTDADAEVRVALLGPGDLFGETALVDGRASEVEARASADSPLLRVDAAAVGGVIRQRPEVGLLALRRLAARSAAE